MRFIQTEYVRYMLMSQAIYEVVLVLCITLNNNTCIRMTMHFCILQMMSLSKCAFRGADVDNASFLLVQYVKLTFKYYILSISLLELMPFHLEKRVLFRSVYMLNIYSSLELS